MAEPIPVDEARRRVLAEARTLATERVPLAAALGRVLADDVMSTVDVPPFDPSAMDGFAVPAGAEGSLAVAGEARAGRPFAAPLAPGSAVRISTGAEVPEGTAAVVPLERASDHGQTVEVPLLEPGANVRRAGQDVRAGQRVLGAGTALGAAELGVLAATGHADVPCPRRPRVAVIATGDELVAPGEPLGAGRIWSSNAVALGAQVALAGGDLVIGETVADDPAAIRAVLERALAATDVVCVSGGVSVGPHDHVKPALAELGVTERFWGVALRPGKPTWFGVARPALVFGLPGNPVSAMVTFQLFARPALRALQGAEPLAPRGRARLAAALARHPTRDQAVRCRLRLASGGLELEPTGAQASHVLSSMVGAGALALVGHGEGELAAGESVEFELLGTSGQVSCAP